ncbi:hypothetical protein KC727_02275 [Candidatus Kaiserbacteria bacterium]|nr:hypothetical protein [Candidatus Kaiserbacteria bacterium]
MWLWRKRKRVPHAKPELSVWWHVFYGLVALAVVGLLGTGVWYGTRQPIVTLDQIIVEGGETIPHEDVTHIVEQALEGSYVFLIPRRFTYLYPKGTITEHLLALPRLHDLTLTVEERTTLHITFEEYVPHALWCLAEDDAAPCYFVSDEGYAFAAAPPLRGGVFTRYIIAGTGELMEGYPLSPEMFTTTEQFIAGLIDTVGYRTRSVTETEDGDIIYTLSGGGDILVAGDMSAEDGLENLRAVLSSSKFAHLAPGNFAYIDLRFGSKVFVKEELVAPGDEASQ